MDNLACCGNCAHRTGDRCDKQRIQFDNPLRYRGVCDLWLWDNHYAEDRPYFHNFYPAK